MSQYGATSLALPRLGRALKGILIAILVLGIVQAFVSTWVPKGAEFFEWFACKVDAVYSGQVWRLVTSGFVTSPEHYSHLLFTLLGLFFLAPDLERRWGGARLLRFLAIAVVMGNLTAMAVSAVAPADAQGRFHPSLMFGAMAAITAVSVAWSRENSDVTVRVFFVIPVRGKVLLWVTLGFCVLDLIYPVALSEGVVAPFGGVLAGLVFGGSPSLARSLYLRLKLLVMRRRADGLRSEDLLSSSPPRRARPGSPPLRVLSGGLDVENKPKAPKDKRYLN